MALGSSPQPCLTSGPSAGHSIVSGCPCGQLTPLLPPAPRAGLLLCCSRWYSPEEVAELIPSPTAPSYSHRAISPRCSLTDFTCIPKDLNKVDASPGGRRTPLPIVSTMGMSLQTHRALSPLLTGVTSAFCVPGLHLYPSWCPKRQGGGHARADACWSVPLLEAVGGAGCREQDLVGRACGD